MDVLLRLRVLIWLLVLSLWGVMVYQYLGEEEAEVARMKRVVNPYAEPAPLPPAPPDLVAAAPSAPEPAVNAPAAVLAPAAQAPAAASPGVVVPSEYAGPAPVRDGRRVPPVAATPDAGAARAARRAEAQARRARLEDRSAPPADAPVPPGFVKTQTRHFNIYAEQYPASERFEELVENLHSNLMLDLAPFSPWASDERVTIFLFKNQSTYRAMTGRPSWSGGASSVPKRKVYVYESEELPGILAHELTHIYYDGFFLEGVTNPLWLSEGMATLVQVERGLSAPNWLRENLVLLERGEGFALEDMVEVRSTAGWPDERVRLWYAQSYSVVRFLIRTQYRASFYKFSAHLRDGRPAAESLYRAYGAPYTRLKALEHAWRYELSRASMAKLGAP